MVAVINHDYVQLPQAGMRNRNRNRVRVRAGLLAATAAAAVRAVFIGADNYHVSERSAGAGASTVVG